MNRLNRLREEMRNKGIDGFFISKVPNVRYISGFTDSDAYLFITPSKEYIITDGRYTEQAEKECIGFIVEKWARPGNTLEMSVDYIAEENNISKIAFEKENVSFALYEKLRSKLTSVELVPVEGIVEELRYVKDEEEIQCTRKAAVIADKAFSKILDFVKVGMTEKKVALELEYYMKKEGADGLAFDTILISGAKSSLLHGKPGDKVIENGDFLLFDYGAMYKGYRSDMTRTIIMGTPNEKQLDVYNAVKKAQEDAQKSIRTGVSTKVPDDLARLASEKYIEYYYSGIGHGVGLELHEQPFISYSGNRIFEENCIVTVEPGIYIPDWGGVRIEDTVVVKKHGVEILTNSSKELICIK
ncbi:MAG: Xaa-Pro peptidase family protein [Clostridium sp.]